jgi:hypothetical protein
MVPIHLRPGIRFNQTSAQSINGPEHRLWFTFIHNANLPALDVRFERMAERIRWEINYYFQRDPEANHPYLIDFIPSDGGAGGTRQKTVRKANSITGRFLQTIYEAILHSQETVEIDGFKVFFFIFYFLFFYFLFFSNYVIDSCSCYRTTNEKSKRCWWYSTFWFQDDSKTFEEKGIIRTPSIGIVYQ